MKHLLTPGLDLRIALGKVRDEVMTSTGGRQEPYVAGSLGGEVVALVPGAASAWRPTPAAGVVGAFNPTRAAVPLTATEERALRPKDSFKECEKCPEMVVVPAGSFLMGSPVGEVGRIDIEGPQHRVTLVQPFAIGKFEITFAEWDACVEAGGCGLQPRWWGMTPYRDPHDGILGLPGWGRGKRPVIDVSWDEIKREYLPWLSRLIGKTYRLPTEAEWEYAARAGTTTRYSFGDTISKRQAHFAEKVIIRDEDGPGTMPVGSFQPNAFGLFDMHGNVFEFVQDCLHANYNGAPLDGSAWTREPCFAPIRRGGSWITLPSGLRSAHRNVGGASLGDNATGFRVVRTLAP